MKKIILGAILALVLFVLIFIFIAPASTISGMVADRVPGLSLNQVEGTLWSTEVGSLQFKNLKLTDLQLDTNPFGLLFGQLNSQVKLDDPKLKLTSEVNLSVNNYKLSDASFEVDTAYVSSLVRLPIKGLLGVVSGNLPRLEMTQQKIFALEGEGRWDNAVIQYPNSDLELGTINFRLSKVEGSDNTARVDILENQGVLDLKGYIEVSLDKRFNMNLSTTKSLPQNLNTWLSRWGRTEGNRIYLEWQGQLP